MVCIIDFEYEKIGLTINKIVLEDLATPSELLCLSCKERFPAFREILPNDKSEYGYT